MSAPGIGSSTKRRKRNPVIARLEWAVRRCPIGVVNNPRLNSMAPKRLIAVTSHKYLELVDRMVVSLKARPGPHLHQEALRFIRTELNLRIGLWRWSEIESRHHFVDTYLIRYFGAPRLNLLDRHETQSSLLCGLRMVAAGSRIPRHSQVVSVSISNAPIRRNTFVRLHTREKPPHWSRMAPLRCRL